MGVRRQRASWFVGAAIAATLALPHVGRADELPTGPVVPTALPAPEPTPPDDADDWSFSIGPYLWLPHLTGNAGIGGLQAQVGTSFWDVIGSGDFAIGLMARGEAWWKERAGIFLDGTWMFIHQDKNLAGTLLEFDVTSNQGLIELGGMYRFARGRFQEGREDSATWELEAMAGVRVTILNSDIDFVALSNRSDFDATEVWADPLLGGRGTIRFGPEQRWHFALRGDLGGFGVGSDFTWNVFGGFGYDFRIRRIAAQAMLGGRALYQDYDSGPFSWEVTQYGPVLALNFPF